MRRENRAQFGDFLDRLRHRLRRPGRTWSETFGNWLRQNGFDEIDKSVRSRLQSCLDNLVEIEAWRQTLGLTLRLQLNHPNAVLRRWQATRQVPSAPHTSPVRPGLREINVKLQEEVDAMALKLRRLEDGEDRGPQITRTDTAADIVRVLMEWLPASKRHPVAAGLMQALKSTEPKKASEPYPVPIRCVSYTHLAARVQSGEREFSAADQGLAAERRRAILRLPHAEFRFSPGGGAG